MSLGEALPDDGTMPVGEVPVNTDHLHPPGWLSSVGPTIADEMPGWFAEFRPPEHPARRAAVLILAAPCAGARDRGSTEDPENVGFVLTERAHTMRAHAAQVAFPGGHEDPKDDGPTGCALREAEEEVGVRPETVAVVSQLPSLYMMPRQNMVTPVIGWWREPHPIGVVSEIEVARVELVPAAELLDPANRFTVVGPRGYRGPGFGARGLFVWGFTAQLLDAVFTTGGLTRPWDTDVVRPLPEVQLSAYGAGRA